MKNIFLLVLLFCTFSLCSAQNNVWIDIYGKTLRGPSSQVHALSASSLGLFVAGGMEFVNGNTPEKTTVNNMAKWRDTIWERVGNGVNNGTNGRINCFVKMSQGLVACGNFDSVAGINAQCIARWGGTNWEALTSTVKGVILSVDAKDSTLYVGGVIDSINGQPRMSIAKHNGSTWSSLGAGLRKIYRQFSPSPFGQVKAIACSDNYVYAAGFFDSAGNVSAKNIARWDGTSWSALGDGIDGDIHDMLVMPNGDLIVAGRFENAGSVTAKNIARWNGTSWSTFANLSINQCIYALAKDSNQLYVGGDITHCGTDTSHGVIRWDGNSWQSVGGGVWGPVFSLDFFDGSLYVGGRFTRVGSNKLQTLNIARWQVRGGAENSSYNNSSNESLFAIRSYPNPIKSDRVSIEFTVQQSGYVSIQFVSNNGTVIDEIAPEFYKEGKHIIEWKLPAGTSSQSVHCNINQNGHSTSGNIIISK